MADQVASHTQLILKLENAVSRTDKKQCTILLAEIATKIFDIISTFSSNPQMTEKMQSLMAGAKAVLEGPLNIASTSQPKVNRTKIQTPDKTPVKASTTKILQPKPGPSVTPPESDQVKPSDNIEFITEDGELIDLTKDDRFEPSNDYSWKSVLDTRDFKDITDTTLNIKFKKNAFRDGQLEVIAAIYSGKDVIVNKNAGFGKTLCFELPALLKKGVTVIVSPLHALICDQAAKLDKLMISCAILTGETNKQDSALINDLLRAEDFDVRYLFTSPEALASNTELQTTLNILFEKRHLQRLIIDEAHLVLQWGILKWGSFIKEIKTKLPGLQIVCFTAAATTQTCAILISQMGLQNPVVLTDTIYKKNIIITIESKAERAAVNINAILKYIHPELKNSVGIVYCTEIDECEKLAQKLRMRKFKAEAYHDKLDPIVKNKNQSDWESEAIKILCVRTAVGLGTSKENVRFIIHVGMPDCIETYVREIGRAGRDGQLSRAFLLRSTQEIAHRLFEIENEQSLPQKVKEFKKKSFKKMAYLVKPQSTCLHEAYSEHFGEKVEIRCGLCTHCKYMAEVRTLDMTKEANKILEVVKTLNEKYLFKTSKKGFTCNEVIRIMTGTKGANTAFVNIVKQQSIDGDTGVYKIFPDGHRAHSHLNLIIDELIVNGNIKVTMRYNKYRNVAYLTHNRDILGKFEIQVASEIQGSEEQIKGEAAEPDNEAEIADLTTNHSDDGGAEISEINSPALKIHTQKERPIQTPVASAERKRPAQVKLTTSESGGKKRKPPPLLVRMLSYDPANIPELPRNPNQTSNASLLHAATTSAGGVDSMRETDKESKATPQKMIDKKLYTFSPHTL